MQTATHVEGRGGPSKGAGRPEHSAHHGDVRKWLRPTPQTPPSPPDDLSPSRARTVSPCGWRVHILGQRSTMRSRFLRCGTTAATERCFAAIGGFRSACWAADARILASCGRYAGVSCQDLEFRRAGPPTKAAKRHETTGHCGAMSTMWATKTTSREPSGLSRFGVNPRTTGRSWLSPAPTNRSS